MENVRAEQPWGVYPTVVLGEPVALGRISHLSLCEDLDLVRWGSAARGDLACVRRWSWRSVSVMRALKKRRTVVPAGCFVVAFGTGSECRLPPLFVGSWTYASYVLVRTGTLIL